MFRKGICWVIVVLVIYSIAAMELGTAYFIWAVGCAWVRVWAPLQGDGRA